MAKDNSINFNIALTLLDHGFGAIPCSPTKVPIPTGWQKNKITDNQLRSASWDRIGISVSTTDFPIECLDFDLKHDDSGTIYTDFKVALHDPELLSRLFIQKTMNDGYHLIYRIDEDIERGSVKLAYRGKTKEAVIETKGQGGQFVYYPEGQVQGNILNLQSITVAERNRLIETARSLNEGDVVSHDNSLVKVAQRDRSEGIVKSGNHTSDSPLDLYNESLTVEDAIMIAEEFGWTVHSEDNEKIQLTRPNKDRRDGISATLYRDTKVVKNWSTSVDLPTEQGISFAEFHAAHKYNSDYLSQMSKYLMTEVFVETYRHEEKPTSIHIGDSWLKKIVDDIKYEENPLSASDLPKFTEEIFNGGSKLISRLVGHVNTPNDKEVIFLSALTTLSAMMPEVTFEYDDDILYPNLYMYLLGPAASGKGKMTLLEKAMVKPEQYWKDHRKDMNQACINAGIQEDSPEFVYFGRRTKFKIPVNVSTTRLYQLLEANDGRGMMFTTEADTMVNATSNEWGNYTELFRKAYHHETLDLSRVTDDVEILVENPRLSAMISSTYDQMVRLIKSEENGTFSRFTFYNLGKAPIKDSLLTVEGSIKASRGNLTTVFREEGERLEDVFKKCNEFPMHLRADSKETDEYLVAAVKDLADKFDFLGEKFDSSVVRMGLIVTRIAVINAVLCQRFEGGILKPKIRLKDVKYAVAVGRILIEHSYYAYVRLTKDGQNIEDRDEFIVSLHERGYSLRAIGNRVGLSKTAVGAIINKSK